MHEDSTVASAIGSVDDYQRFCVQIRLGTGVDLTAYKRGQMERRIRAMANRVGAETLQEYWHTLSRDQAALRDFMDHITINVSEFFRNPEKFEDLRQFVLPQLLQQGQPLSIWSAGCSYGAEPYSLKIVLQRLTPGIRHRILATDIDEGILAKARSAVYQESDLRNVPDIIRRQYFVRTETGFQLIPRIQADVEFKRHDLLRDPFPSHMDLILCRNVIIYFNDEAKHKLFTRFSQTLRPGGFLLLGSTERIADAQAHGFSSPKPFIYQKTQ